MKLLDEILAYNEKFVENREYENFETDKFPHKRLVILSCMDTRLVELLPRAMNMGNGDIKIIKTGKINSPQKEKSNFHGEEQLESFH